MLGNTTYLYTPYSGAFNYFVDDKGGVDFLDLRGY
jgi:hypothetical protein